MLSHLAARERGSRHSLVGVRSLALRLGPDLELHGHTGCVNTLRWSRGGRLLVSGGDDVTVKVWRYPDGALLSTLPTGHTGNIFCAAMLPGYSHGGAGRDAALVSCAADGEVRITTMTRPGVVRRFRGHTGMVYKLLCPANDTHTVLSCSADGTVRELDVRCKDRHEVIVDLSSDDGGSSSILSIAGHPTRAEVFGIGGKFGDVLLYDRRRTGSARRGPFMVCRPGHAGPRNAEREEGEEKNKYATRTRHLPEQRP